MFFDARGVARNGDSATVSLLDAALLSYAAFKSDTGDRLKMRWRRICAGHGADFARLFPALARELTVPRTGCNKHRRCGDDEIRRDAGRRRRHVEALRLWGQRNLGGASTILTSPCRRAARSVGAEAWCNISPVLCRRSAYASSRDAVELRSRHGTRVCPATVMRSVVMLSVLGMRRLRRGGAGGPAKAVAFCPDDIWAGRAVAHVCGWDRHRRRSSLARPGERRLESDANNFAYVAWHRCCSSCSNSGAKTGQLRFTIAECGRNRAASLLDITNAVSLRSAWSNSAPRSRRSRRPGRALGERGKATCWPSAMSIMRWRAGRDRQQREFRALAPIEQSLRGVQEETESAIMREVRLALGDAALAHRRGATRARSVASALREELRRIGNDHAPARSPAADPIPR